MAKAIFELRRAPFVRYAFATAVIGLVLLPAYTSWPLSRETGFLLLFPAAMAVAHFAGPGPCVLATALGALGFRFAFTERGQFLVLDDIYDLHLGIFITFGLAVAWTSSRRRRRSEELRESEQRFRATFDQAAMGVAHAGLNGRWLLVNDRMCVITGYQRKELLKLRFQDITHPADLAAGESHLHSLLAGEIESHSFEKRCIRKDGSVAWINLTVSLVRDASRKPKYFVAVVEDISARKQMEEDLRRSHEELERRVQERTAKLAETNTALRMEIAERARSEQALRESERRFRLIAETIDEVFWVADVGTNRISYISPAYERISGHTCQSLYEDHQSFLDAVHEDERPKVTANLTLALKGIGQPFSSEYRIIRPDGTIRWIWNRGFPIRDEAGLVCRYVGVAQDITDRRDSENALRESEQRFRLIAETIDEVFWMTEIKKKKIYYVSPAYERVWGRSRESLYDGSHSFFNAVHPEDLGRVIQTLELQKAGLPFDHEYRIVRPDGSIRQIWDRGFPVRGEPSQEGRYVGVAQDVTERKRLEGQFLQAQKMEAIGVLAGGVAHDFNNLLTVINGYAEIMSEHLDPDSGMSKDLEQIRKAGRHATSLASQLLAFSRRQILQPKILDLNNSIAEAEKILRRLIGEDVELIVITQPKLGLVRADPGQVQQVIMNIAVNARDAMPHGGRLTIETADVYHDEAYVAAHEIGRPGPYVMLAISDNGVGMDKGTRSHIFEPFFTTKEPGKGSGLGLSTVYGIVKQSDGFVWVYSEPGQGTTFKVYLPRLVTEAEPPAFQREADPSLRGWETVLVVEDDSMVRTLTVEILGNLGYKVIEAQDAEEAASKAESHAGEIHLLLTDVIMPGLNGKELAALMAAARPATKALFVSGYTDNVIVNEGILDAGVAFLQKPFTTGALAAKVREVLDG